MILWHDVGAHHDAAKIPACRDFSGNIVRQVQVHRLLESPRYVRHISLSIEVYKCVKGGRVVAGGRTETRRQ
jgi:hypothetical protein